MTLGDSFGSPAVIDRPNVDKRKRRDRVNDNAYDMSEDEWLLRIYNDGVNTREYVARCLVQVVGLCEERAFYTMMAAHNYGIAKVGEYNQEVAELYWEQLGNNGIKCDVVPASEC